MKKFAFFLLLVAVILSTFANLLDPAGSYFFSFELFFRISSGFFICIVLLLYIKKILSFNFTLNKMDILVLLFYLYSIIQCVLISKNNVIWNLPSFLSGTNLLIFYFIFKGFFTTYNKDQAAQQGFIIALFVLAFVSIAVGLLEYFSIIPVLYKTYRMSGGLFNTGAYANYISIFFPFFLAICLKGKSFYIKSGFAGKLSQLISALITLSSLVVLILSNARTSWIACFVSATYVVLSHEKIGAWIKKFFNTKIKKVTVSILGLVLLVISVTTLFQMKKDSSNGRLFIWKMCIHMISDKPLFGHGYNSFNNTYNAYQVDYFKTHPDDTLNSELADNATYAFNDYLEITVERGLTGLILFLIIIFLALKKRKTFYDSENNDLFIASRASLIAILTCSLFSYPLSVIQNLILFVLFLSYVSACDKSGVCLQPFKNKTVYFFSIIIAFLFIMIMEYHEIKLYLCNSHWRKAYKYTENKEYQKAFRLYAATYPKLKNDCFFMYNYGATLPYVQDYRKSVIILETTKIMRTGYNLYMNLGSSYEGLKEYRKAEENYLMASYLIPSRFEPKYCLFKLFEKTSEHDKSATLASTIDRMPIKVYSPFVGKIKNEILHFLENERKDTLNF